MKTQNENQWDMHAEFSNGRFLHFGNEWYVKACGGDPIPVRMTERKDGEYYGWIDRDEDSPVMIWPSRRLFEMCFTYGSKIEVEKGQGRVIRLICESRTKSK